MNLNLVTAAISLWKGVNGGKFNIGAATVLLTYGFQHFLPQLGMSEDQTTIMVSTIIQGIGYVILIAGAIHKIIKAWQVKKSALPTSGAATVAKLLILGAVLFGFSSPAQAVEIFKRPMNYFLTPRVIPQGYNMPDTAYWVIKPSITVPLLQLRESSDSTSKLDVSTMASAGGGITYERDVVINGKNYSTMSISIIELLADNPPGYRPDFAAGIVAGIYNNVIQFGAGYDFGPLTSKSRWFLMAGFGIALTRN